MSSGIPVATGMTQAPCPSHRVSTAYQKARLSVFVNPAHRHQLDALADEWDVPLTEAVRRVLSSGLRSIMHRDTG
jgi:hypothetical protein